MRAPKTGLLTLPGARIYYEVRGTGPALLLIPTGNGDAAPFEPVANLLADRYTVITYDRRGFSRSQLDGPVDDWKRLAVDADDAHSLLEHLAEPPAHVFGTCSGATVALAMLERYPEQVSTLIAYEPPLAAILPDAAQWLKFYADLYDTYQNDGVEVAREMFRTAMGLTTSTRAPKDAEPERLDEMLDRLRRNQPFWFEHEVLPFPKFVPDIAALRATTDRLILAGGRASREHFPYRGNVVLAEQLGIEVVDFPGGHVAHVTHPVEFAETLDQLLSSRNTH